MRRDENAPGSGRERAESGPERGRSGSASFGRLTGGRIALLLAAAGLPWLPALQAPPGDLPMSRSRGDSRVVINHLAFSPDGQTIATVDEKGRARVRAVGTGGLDRELDARDRARVVAFSPDGRHLAVGREGPDVLLHDLDQGGPGRLLGIPVQQTKGLHFSPDGRILAVSSYRSRETILWDLAEGKQRARFPGPVMPVIALAFASDGRELAAVSTLNPAVQVWDVATGRARAVATEASAISDGLSPDGRLLATANADMKLIRLWDLRSGGLIRVFEGLPSPIRSVAFSPDGKIVAMGTSDHFVVLWSVASGRELRRLDARTDVIRKVLFSPDGRTLAATGNDDEIRLWDVAGVVDDERPDAR